MKKRLLIIFILLILQIFIILSSEASALKTVWTSDEACFCAPEGSDPCCSFVQTFAVPEVSAVKAKLTGEVTFYTLNITHSKGTTLYSVYADAPTEIRLGTLHNITKISAMGAPIAEYTTTLKKGRISLEYGENFALDATCAASSYWRNSASSNCQKAIDNSLTTDWAAYMEDGVDPGPWWIKLEWNEQKTINEIILYGRTTSNKDEYITRATLEFSNGYTLSLTSDLKNSESQTFSFAPQTVTWVMLYITGVNAVNVGLSEFEVYSAALEELDLADSSCTQGTTFAWPTNAPETDNGSNNYCCGNNPEQDLGHILTLQPPNNDYSSLCYDNEWLKGDQYQFEIYTIVKPNITYDVVSNSRFWHECSQASYNNPLQQHPENPQDALRFICYNENSKSSFAECCPTGIYTDSCYNQDLNHKKVRNLGEPTMLLDRTQHNFLYKSSSPPISQYIGAGEGYAYKNIPIEIPQQTNADTLEFFVRFSKDADFTLMLLNGTGASIGDYIENSRRGHASSQRFEIPLGLYIYNDITANKWLHVIVPLAQVQQPVTQMVFFTDVTELTENVTLNISTIFLKSDDTMYCGDYESNYWLQELDDPKMQAACNAIKAYDWTGTQCCGDDNSMYFTELFTDTQAGCWFGIPVQNNSKATDRVLFLNNAFYGCNLTDEELGLVKSNTCEVKGSFFCGYDNKWSNEASNTPASERNTSKSTPEDAPEACCAQTKCWNGTSCINSSASAYDFVTINGKNWRCVNGEWKTSLWKWDWDSSKQAICNEAEQCLVDADGTAANNNQPETYKGKIPNSQNPQCINDTQFIEDHYCNNGAWTSRTKLLALQLLDTVTEQNYILYCDNYVYALNDYGEIEQFLQGQPPLSKKYVNNICILKQNGNVAFAFSLNNKTDFQINGLDFMAEVFGKTRTYCSDIGTDADFTKCSGDDAIWYSGRLNSIIYSRQGITLQPTALDTIVEWFKSIIAWITGKTLPAAIGAGTQLDFANRTRDYSTIYIAKSGTKEMYAIQETINKTGFITINYKNFTTDFCPTLEAYSLAHSKPINCTSAAETTTIITNAAYAQDYWQQLTSALRISPWQLP